MLGKVPEMVQRQDGMLARARRAWGRVSCAAKRSLLGERAGEKALGSLRDAVLSSNAPEALKWMEKGAHPAAGYFADFRKSLLMIAARDGNLELARILAKGGADPNFCGASGEWASTEAASAGDVGMIALLRELGASLGKGRQLAEAMNKAAERGHVLAMRHLERHGRLGQEQKEQVLVFSASGGLDVLWLALSWLKGVEKEACKCKRKGLTPLMSACRAGRIECAFALLPLSDAGDCDDSGWSALHYLCAGHSDPQHRARRLSLARELSLARVQGFRVKNSSPTTPAHMCAQDNDLEMLELLSDSFDPWAIDEDGMLAIHRAALAGSVESLVWIAHRMAGARGPRIASDIKSAGGKTPLMLCTTAASHWYAWLNNGRWNQRKTACGRALLEMGADPDLTDENGDSALELAASCGDVELLEAMLEMPWGKKRDWAKLSQVAKAGREAQKKGCKQQDFARIEERIESLWQRELLRQEVGEGQSSKGRDRL